VAPESPYAGRCIVARVQATTPELRPLSVGEVLDVAIKIFFRNATTLFAIVLPIVAPVQLFSSLIEVSLATDEDPFATTSPTGEVTFDTSEIWLYVTGFVVIFALAIVASTAATGACFKAVGDAYLGERPSTKASLGFALRRVHSILWVTVLGGFVAFLGLLLCIVPGVWLYVAFAVAVPALLMEGVRGGRALGRSRQLVKGRWWPTFGHHRPGIAPRRHRRLRDHRRARGARAGRSGQRRRLGRSGDDRRHGREHADDAVPGGVRDRPVLRPARPQGRIRPPASRGATRPRPRARGRVPPRAGRAAAAASGRGRAAPVLAAAARVEASLRPVRAVGLAALVLTAVLAGPAAAADVSPERLRELATKALTDQAALEELRRVDSVAGRPVDVRRLLEDAEDEELEGRLRVLSGPGAGRLESAAEARGRAREILSERRFQEPSRLRPFREPLEWLRDRLRSALEPIVSRVAPHVPGGRSTVWTILALIVVALATVLAARVVRRRTAEAVQRVPAASTGPVDPRRLEREADEAEWRGDLERSLRLRFRAGLVRLQRADVLPARDSLTSGEVARRLRSPDFDRVAATFDEVVYGRRPADPADVTSSRAAWSRVLERAAA
jgi:hypothetical protein